MSGDDQIPLPVHSRLVQRVSLADAAAQLRAEPRGASTVPRKVALLRQGPVSVILFVFEQGAVLKEHKADGEVVIQTVTGRMAVTVAGSEVQLGPGDLVSLAPGEVHSVSAIEASDMLLTLCRVPAAAKV